MPRNGWTLRWREGNQIDLLQNGGEFFPALHEAIDAAQFSVHIETYIFYLDDTGRSVLDRLRRACERGIKVRVVIDGFGSLPHAAEIAATLADMGAQCRIYRPEPVGIRMFKFDYRRLRRMHRKVAVVDNRVAFVGGVNIIGDFLDVPDDGAGPKPRFDFTVRLQGPIVADVVTAQRGLWLRIGIGRERDWANIYRRITEGAKRYFKRRSKPLPVYRPGHRAILLLRDNVRFRQSIENVYLKAIGRARNEILIANAYFFPGHRLRVALERAAARGVRVRLLLQGRSEYPMQYRASRSMYSKVLDDGIEIYEYMPSYLHAKVAVIDSYAMVGSSNLDPFSLLLAREANVFIEDAGFAAELEDALETVMKNDARRVTQESLQKRSFIGRFIDSASYMMLRIGVALTGKSSEY